MSVKTFKQRWRVRSIWFLVAATLVCLWAYQTALRTPGSSTPVVHRPSKTSDVELAPPPAAPPARRMRFAFNSSLAAFKQTEAKANKARMRNPKAEFKAQISERFADVLSSPLKFDLLPHYTAQRIVPG